MQARRLRSSFPKIGFLEMLWKLAACSEGSRGVRITVFKNGRTEFLFVVKKSTRRGAEDRPRRDITGVSRRSGRPFATKYGGLWAPNKKTPLDVTPEGRLTFCQDVRFQRTKGTKLYRLAHQEFEYAFVGFGRRFVLISSLSSVLTFLLLSASWYSLIPCSSPSLRALNATESPRSLAPPVTVFAQAPQISESVAGVPLSRLISSRRVSAAFT